MQSSWSMFEKHWQTCKNMIAVTYSQLPSNCSLLVFWNSYPSHTIQSFKRPRCAWIPDENNHSNTGGPLGNFSERFGQWKVGTSGSLCGMVIRKNDDQSVVICLTNLTNLYKKTNHLRYKYRCLVGEEFLEFGQLLQLHREIIRANTQDAMPRQTHRQLRCVIYIYFFFLRFHLVCKAWQSYQVPTEPQKQHFGRMIFEVCNAIFIAKPWCSGSSSA